jgi:hypothetical protein
MKIKTRFMAKSRSVHLNYFKNKHYLNDNMRVSAVGIKTALLILALIAFFNNPIVCLDGDTSGQRAALRAAERLFPLISSQEGI